MSDTIFDKIIRKEIPAKIILENEWAIAFHDVNPQAPIHALVIPKKKMARFANLKNMTAEETGHYIKTVSEVAAKLGLEESGYRVVFNNGKDGGQEVEYIHAHILGGRSLQWPPG